MSMKGKISEKKNLECCPVCQILDDGTLKMICCDCCAQWYHFECVSISI